MPRWNNPQKKSPRKGQTVLVTIDSQRDLDADPKERKPWVGIAVYGICEDRPTCYISPSRNYGELDGPVTGWLPLPKPSQRKTEATKRAEKWERDHAKVAL